MGMGIYALPFNAFTGNEILYFHFKDTTAFTRYELKYSSFFLFDGFWWVPPASDAAFCADALLSMR
jgi:hypothetical protein